MRTPLHPILITISLAREGHGWVSRIQANFTTEWHTSCGRKRRGEIAVSEPYRLSLGTNFGGIALALSAVGQKSLGAETGGI